MCSLHVTHPSAHTWSSGQPTLQRPGSSWGFGALLKSLSRGHFLPEPGFERTTLGLPWVTSGFKSNALSIRPRLPLNMI